MSQQYGYIAFFGGKREEIRAATLLEAKQEAIKRFKPSKKNQHMVHVVLAEKPDGETVTHDPGELP